jgi:hypothetical protein
MTRTAAEYGLPIGVDPRVADAYGWIWPTERGRLISPSRYGETHVWRPCAKKGEPRRVPGDSITSCINTARRNAETCEPEKTDRSRPLEGMIEAADRDSLKPVATAGTTPTTHLPHRLCRVLADRSRSQPVRVSRKCLL